jgi:hypothetical protein
MVAIFFIFRAKFFMNLFLLSMILEPFSLINNLVFQCLSKRKAD